MKAANIQKGVTFTGIAAMLAIAGAGFLISPAYAQVVGGQSSQIQGNKGGTVINARSGMVQNGGTVIGGSSDEVQVGGLVVGGSSNVVESGGCVISGSTGQSNVVEGGGIVETTSGKSNTSESGGIIITDTGYHNFAGRVGTVILGCSRMSASDGLVHLCGPYINYTTAQVAALIESTRSNIQQEESQVRAAGGTVTASDFSCSPATEPASAPAPAVVASGAPAFIQVKVKPEDQQAREFAVHKAREVKRLNDKITGEEARHARKQAKIAREEQKKLATAAQASTAEAKQTRGF